MGNDSLFFKLTCLIISTILLSNIATYSTESSSSLKEFSDYLSQVIDRGLTAQSLKDQLDKEIDYENDLQLDTNNEREKAKHKRFYRWPSAATRTRVKLLSHHPNQDVNLADHYRRKELEKDMMEKNKMYQYFHG